MFVRTFSVALAGAFVFAVACGDSGEGSSDATGGRGGGDATGGAGEGGDKGTGAAATGGGATGGNDGSGAQGGEAGAATGGLGGADGTGGGTNDGREKFYCKHPYSTYCKEYTAPPDLIDDLAYDCSWAEYLDVDSCSTEGVTGVCDSEQGDVSLREYHYYEDTAELETAKEYCLEDGGTWSDTL
jgi:hypothetical protein